MTGQVVVQPIVTVGKILGGCAWRVTFDWDGCVMGELDASTNDHDPHTALAEEVTTAIHNMIVSGTLPTTVTVAA